MDILFLIGRVLFGGLFIINGINHFTKFEMMKAYASSKGTPLAGVAVTITGVFIFLGGLGIIAGVYIQYAVLFLVVSLVLITFVMHAFWRAKTPEERMADTVHFMKNIALIGAALIFLAVPEPWAYALF
ncbi:MAG: DoxX family protein [Candidatus Jorgensenbacteria bacterium]|nr:DoxX family protein [Candidatus Jorgensenbacteria bacterium]